MDKKGGRDAGDALRSRWAGAGRSSGRLLISAVALTVVLIAGMGFGAAAESADASGQFRVFGSGNLTCERWLADRQEGNPSASQSEMWVAGYITAYNQFVHKEFDVSERQDGDYLLKWIDDYCRKQPPNQLVFAGARKPAGVLIGAPGNLRGKRYGTAQ